MCLISPMEHIVIPLVIAILCWLIARLWFSFKLWISTTNMATCLISLGIRIFKWYCKKSTISKYMDLASLESNITELTQSGHSDRPSGRCEKGSLLVCDWGSNLWHEKQDFVSVSWWVQYIWSSKKVCLLYFCVISTPQTWHHNAKSSLKHFWW